MTHHTLNWLLAAAIAATISLSYLLDGPSDIQAAQDVAADVAAAQAQAQQVAKGGAK